MKMRKKEEMTFEEFCEKMKGTTRLQNLGELKISEAGEGDLLPEPDPEDEEAYNKEYPLTEDDIELPEGYEEERHQLCLQMKN